MGMDQAQPVEQKEHHPITMCTIQLMWSYQLKILEMPQAKAPLNQS